MILNKINSAIKIYRTASNKKIELPRVIQFPINDICNSRCQMCNIWKNKKSEDEISVEQVYKVFSSSLFRKVESIGINGGEPTLRKDIADIIDALFQTIPTLKNISLITNGFNNEDILKKIKAIRSVIDKHNGRLDLMFSIDGYESTHDRVRGKDGNFSRITTLLENVQKLGLADNLRVGCTIIKENVLDLQDLYNFCLKKQIYIKYRLGIPHQRLYTLNKKEPYSLSLFEKYELSNFLNGLIAHYEKDKYQIFFYESLVDQILYNKPRKSGCDWQHRGATISSKGELLYCAVESKTLTSLGEFENYEDVYFREEAHLKEIRKNKCDDCSHDYVGIPDLNELKKIHLNSIKRKLRKYSILENIIDSLTERRYSRVAQERLNMIVK